MDSCQSCMAGEDPAQVESTEPQQLCFITIVDLLTCARAPVKLEPSMTKTWSAYIRHSRRRFALEELSFMPRC